MQVTSSARGLLKIVVTGPRDLVKLGQLAMLWVGTPVLAPQHVVAVQEPVIEWRGGSAALRSWREYAARAQVADACGVNAGAQWEVLHLGLALRALRDSVTVQGIRRFKSVLHYRAAETFKAFGAWREGALGDMVYLHGMHRAVVHHGVSFVRLWRRQAPWP